MTRLIVREWGTLVAVLRSTELGGDSGGLLESSIDGGLGSRAVAPPWAVVHSPLA